MINKNFKELVKRRYVETMLRDISPWENQIKSSERCKSKNTVDKNLKKLTNVLTEVKQSYIILICDILWNILYVRNNAFY